MEGKHEVSYISGYDKKYTLHRYVRPFNNKDTEWSSIYDDGKEILGVERRYEPNMLKHFRGHWENLAKSGIIRNVGVCRKCADVIESKGVHDMQWCGCGACAVDGGYDYLKRCGTDLIDVSEVSKQKIQVGDWIYLSHVEMTTTVDSKKDAENANKDEMIDFATVYHYLKNRSPKVMADFIAKWLYKMPRQEISKILSLRLTPELFEFYFGKEEEGFYGEDWGEETNSKKSIN